MSEYVEKYQRNELDVEIMYDEDPYNPRQDDNVGTMVCAHSEYRLGDEQYDEDDYYEGWGELEAYLRDERKAVIILPLCLYDHSGITMYVGDTHDRWDGCQVGFIYCTQEDIDREWSGDKEKAENYLKQEVKTYNQYLTGQVYGFSVTNPKNGEEIDSCWGFYGLECVQEEANSIADNFKHPHEAAYAKNASAVHA